MARCAAWLAIVAASCAPMAPDAAAVLGAPPSEDPAPRAAEPAAPPACVGALPACPAAACLLPDPPLAMPAREALSCIERPGGGEAEGDAQCDDVSCTVTRRRGALAEVTWISLDGGVVSGVYDELRLPAGAGTPYWSERRRAWAARAGAGAPLPPRFAEIGAALVEGREWTGRDATCDLWLERHPEGDVLQAACRLSASAAPSAGQ